MQHPDTHDAPIVPYAHDKTRPVSADGGNRPDSERPLDRPPVTDYATDYTRSTEEIEPVVPDLG